MSAIPAELASLLTKVRQPGDFYASGAADFLAPSLEVEGVGPVAFPLLPFQAAQIIAAADPAPFGRGAETVYDPAVRNCGQIGPERVRIGGRHWAGTLDGIVTRAAEGLGVEEPVAAELYKLLVYDQGSFFVSHRDTEKAPGMFATLVVVLPSRYAGGELLVRHKGREVRLDLRRDDPAEAAFAAFYADCVHEILPITQGCRLALVYNLMRRDPAKRGRAPEPPEYGREQARVAALLERWREEAREGTADETDKEGDAGQDSAHDAAQQEADGQDDEEWDEGDEEDEDDDGGDDDEWEDDERGQAGGAAGVRHPEKLVYPLEHAYTPAELGFAALKGADAATARLLDAAARDAGFDLLLAHLSIEESGAAEYADYSWSRRDRRRVEDEFEASDVDDRSMTLSDWQRPGGEPCALGAIPVEAEEIAPPDACDALVPDEQHFHEATGNAGATFERTYHRAALVLWPKERFFAVVSQAGLDATVPLLADLARRWAEGKEDSRSPRWREAHDLAGQMLARWPAPAPYWREDDAGPSHAGQVLAALAQLGDADMIGRFLTEVVAAGSCRIADTPAVVEALGCLPAPRRADLVEQVVAGTAATRLPACADLLSRAAAWPATRGSATREPAGFTGAATKLLDALPGDPAREPPRPEWQGLRTVAASTVVAVMTGLCAVDAGLAGRAAEHMLAWPKTYGLDDVLLPAIRRLDAEPVRGTAAVARLRAACLAQLRARVAEPLAPPADWTRASALPCQCPRCTELASFLADPARKAWVLKAAEAARSHVESTIRTARCDVDTQTDERGRPYSLVCTKNQASYERRAKQRRQDLDDLARLGS